MLSDYFYRLAIAPIAREVPNYNAPAAVRLQMTAQGLGCATSGNLLGGAQDRHFTRPPTSHQAHRLRGHRPL